MELALLAYYAGFFDGEGHVSIRGKSSIRVTIVNTHLPVLEELFNCYGGGIYNTSNEKNGYKCAYQWTVSGTEAKRFLLEILPFLREKRNKVLQCLDVATYRYPKSISKYTLYRVVK